MKPLFKIAIIIFSIIFIFSIILAFVLPSVIDLTRYKGKIEGFISESLQKDVSIKDIKLSVLNGIGAELKDIRIGKEPDLIVEDMKIKVSILPLLKKRIELKGVVLHNINILIKKEAGIEKKILISQLYLPWTSYRSGITELKGVIADLYGGEFIGDIKIEKEARGAKYSLVHRAEKIEIEPLVRDVGSKVVLTGLLKLEGDLKGTGDNLEVLEGNGYLKIGKGKISGLELIKVISSIGIITTKRPISISDYDRISGHYKIGGGYLRTDDLEMVGKDLYLKVVGSYGLVNERLDFLVKGQVIDIPLEIKISGTSSNPIYRLESPGSGKKILEGFEKELGKDKREKKGLGKALRGLF